MKIFLVGSKSFYEKIEEIKRNLEKQGHVVTLPNGYDNPSEEARAKIKGQAEHVKFKQIMMKLDVEKVMSNDAVFVINLEKNGQKGYIGGGSFLEMYEAWKNKKKLYAYNSIENSPLKDEIIGLNPIIINGDLNLIK